MELAPILGMSHVIVDIVETGTTLRENNLEILQDIVAISARLIANKASFKFKNQEIEKIREKMAVLIAQRREDKQKMIRILDSGEIPVCEIVRREAMNSRMLSRL